jgi:hypothetical protein
MGCPTHPSGNPKILNPKPNVLFKYNEYTSWANTPLVYSQSASSLTMRMEQ